MFASVRHIRRKECDDGVAFEKHLLQNYISHKIRKFIYSLLPLLSLKCFLKFRNSKVQNLQQFALLKEKKKKYKSYNRKCGHNFMSKPP